MGFYKMKEDVTVWKKLQDKDSKQYICQLLIEKGTECYHQSGGGGKKVMKNRAEKACVIAIFDLTNSRYLDARFGRKTLTKSQAKLRTRVRHSSYYGKLIYAVGKEVFPDFFSNNSTQCTNGIHFYYKESLALNW